MPKRISKALLCALLIAIAALFAASEAIAFYDNYEPGDFSIPFEIGPYTITLESIEQIEETEYYKWNYKAVNTDTITLTRLNFFAMLIPNCYDVLITVDVDNSDSEPENIKYFGVAVGEDTLDFGRYNQGASVVKVVPNGITEWVIVTTSSTPTVTPALIRHGQGKGVAVPGKVAGPGCVEVECPPPPPPAVRVEPRRQCYQFIAETQPPTCDEPAQSSTFLAEWDGGEPCAVEVWAGYGDGVTCDNVKDLGTKLTGEDLFVVTDESGNNLSEYRTNNSQCDEGWLRFTEPITGCNKRCYVSGGKKYCY